MGRFIAPETTQQAQLTPCKPRRYSFSFAPISIAYRYRRHPLDKTLNTRDRGRLRQAAAKLRRRCGDMSVIK